MAALLSRCGAAAAAGLLSATPLCLSAQIRDSLITAHQIAGVRICDSLARINSVFSQARDTTIVGEDEETKWAAKVVPLAAGRWILFESSWVDGSRVWRASTNSSFFKTRHGLRVGSSVRDVLATRDSLEFDYPEGYLVIVLVAEEIAFQVEDSSARAFWRRFSREQFKEGADPLRSLSPSARIKEFTIGKGCR